MAISEFLMPAMSPTMTEGGISSWQVKEGDKFSTGDVILQISTDKAEIDVEAQDDGVMGKILVQEGTQSVQVGQVIAMLAEEGDDLSSIEAPTETASKSQPEQKSSSAASSPTSSKPPSNNETASKSTTDAPRPTDSQAHGSKPSHKHPTHSRPLLPSVMRVLMLNGIEDASVIKATGFKGQLSKGDVLAHLGKISSPRGSLPEDESHAVADKPAPKQPEQPKLIELDGPSFRQLIAAGLRDPFKAPKPVVQEVPTPRFSANHDKAEVANDTESRDKGREERCITKMSSALNRVQQLASHIVGTGGKDKILRKNDDDVVICSAVRTAFTRGKKGAFKDTCPEELLVHVFKAAVERAKCDVKLVEEIQVGNVLPPGGGATVARMAQLAGKSHSLVSGFPDTSSICSLNRQCSSGLQAVNNIALQIAAGQIDCGIGAGVESMTMGYGAGVMPEKMSEMVMENEQAADCLLPMGITSENVAAKYGITREQQDDFAAKSFQKAAAANKAGKFKDEIVPVKVKVVDPKTDEEKEVTVSEDEGIRDGVTKESLSKLKPVFSKTGSTHAGNASQVSDGAAAVLLARRSFAKKHGLPVIGKFVGTAVTGVEPKLMGIGPAFAIPKILEKTGLTKEDVDLWEINEAFASQAVMSIEHLKLDYNKINPNGGAIAFGHPLGCTGARQIATALSEAKRSGAKVIVSSMCIGSGMGAAAVFVNEQ
ncbi:3-ketoacyl-CoA thiolase with broad chain length specificity [Microbotryomycetes sp. JL201]|nr:3-ketoacyl-CoA thiolase with broad chain length specificity [Microbotryomycetes sp. JL201]